MEREHCGLAETHQRRDAVLSMVLTMIDSEVYFSGLLDNCVGTYWPPHARFLSCTLCARAAVLVRQVVLMDHAEWLQRADKTQEALAAFLKSSFDFFNIYQVRLALPVCHAGQGHIRAGSIGTYQATTLPERASSSAAFYK